MGPDLTPATQTLAKTVTDISDHELSAETPCLGVTVADLLDHVDALCMAFTAAAAKDSSGNGSAPTPDGSRLGPDWRSRIPDRLARLAAAWRAEGAWVGVTRAGGQDMPAEIAGTVAINEVVVHGWDLAAATGHGYSGEPELVQAAFEFAQQAVAAYPDGSPGLFGPPVPVPDNAPRLDKLIGLTGRDPGWRQAVR